MPDPFISREDLSDYLGRPVTTDDGALIAVDAACEMVRSLAEQSFTAGTSTITLDGSGTDALLLPQRPATAAGTVTVGGGTVTDYVLKSNGALIRKYATSSSTEELPVAVWPAGRQNVRVTYEHGYAANDLPRDVRFVALALASRMIVQGVALQETQGSESIRYAVPATDLTSGEKAVLAKYRVTS